jgi:hypothetical protein
MICTSNKPSPYLIVLSPRDWVFHFLSSALIFAGAYGGRSQFGSATCQQHVTHPSENCDLDLERERRGALLPRLPCC